MIEPFLEEQRTQGRFLSSGVFTLGGGPRGPLFAEEELAVLRRVQEAVSAGERSLDMSAVNRREAELLRDHCQFCPIPVLIKGVPVQPLNLVFPRVGRGHDQLPPHYHLAELYFPSVGPGVAVLRSDMGPAKGWIDTAQTLYRKSDEARPLAWRVAVKVAGLTARTRRCPGLACGGALFVHGCGSHEEARAYPVHRGVTLTPLALPGLSGISLVFDASHLKTDLSGLQLIHNDALKQELEHLGQLCRQHLHRFGARMLKRVRTSNAFSWQNLRELKWVAGVAGFVVVSGLGIYAPLPFLSLPLVAGHHWNRRKAILALEERARELMSLEVTRQQLDEVVSDGQGGSRSGGGGVDDVNDAPLLTQEEVIDQSS